jgi:hypothetical protein
VYTFRIPFSYVIQAMRSAFLAVVSSRGDGTLKNCAIVGFAL